MRLDTSVHGSTRKRRGKTLVAFALMLIALAGLVGLVLDSGLLLGAQRQTQNAADAAALAAAMAKLKGSNDTVATNAATDYVQTYNGLSSATVAVNIPPSSGPYSGRTGFVEVIVTYPVDTLLIQLLGNNSRNNAVCRAVAGYEAVAAGEGVLVLDPTARPGLDVSGQGSLRVNGRIIVNSEGGGVDENGNAVNNGNNGFAAKGGQPNSDRGIYALSIDVVGGVDEPSNFKPYVVGDPNPLRAKQLPEPDPLINLPTPTVANGVDRTARGTVRVNNMGASLTGDAGGLNFVATGGELVAGHTALPGEAILFPGIYEEIDISGGLAFFVPGIYVLSTQHNHASSLKITGGVVIAEGIMFYNTGNNYNPDTGTPDINDGERAPPADDGASLGGFSINAGMRFSPINTTAYNYSSFYLGAPTVSAEFDGMLFYQRRRNSEGFSIAGDAAEGLLTGTIYAKWANFQISGQGTYNAQFVCGSMSVTGNGTVTILHTGTRWGKANQVFLVE